MAKGRPLPDMTAVLAKVVKVVHFVYSRHPQADSWRITWNRRGKVRFTAIHEGEERTESL